MCNTELVISPLSKNYSCQRVCSHCAGNVSSQYEEKDTLVPTGKRGRGAEEPLVLILLYIFLCKILHELQMLYL